MQEPVDGSVAHQPELFDSTLDAEGAVLAN
jgi:hypothetical protein